MFDASWQKIGTVVGNASTLEFTFILKSFRSRVGDLVAVRMDVPNSDYSGTVSIFVWGRVISIERYNPFFPYEAAQELSEEGLSLRDTVLSESRDQLQAEVLILGYTMEESGLAQLHPLTYPVQPAADVYYPPAEVVQELLAGGIPSHTPLKIGTLIARQDVEVSISAERVVSRHMAILAMTGGGKTVAARRILRELISMRYPLLILDPHGDYLGLWENREVFNPSEVKLFYPHIGMTDENRTIIEVLISKMTVGLTEPQKEKLGQLLASNNPSVGETVLEYIYTLIGAVNRNLRENSGGRERPTYLVVRRSLDMVARKLERMELTNKRMRSILSRLRFERLPDPEGRPEGIIRPGQVSILYLGGYDRITQTTIASVLLEALFEHRANLSNTIPPFQTIVEEAHTFVPSSREGTTEAPSLETIRKIITEGRKFGTGLVLISQRPSRVDETILSQCNSFLILRIVNPRDQNYVKAVMENLADADAKMMPGFGPGQGIISGQAVRFPLLTQITMDRELMHSSIGDEDFLAQAASWQPDSGSESREIAASVADSLASTPSRSGSRMTRITLRRHVGDELPPVGDIVRFRHTGTFWTGTVVESGDDGSRNIRIDGEDRVVAINEVQVVDNDASEEERSSSCSAAVQVVHDWIDELEKESSPIDVRRAADALFKNLSEFMEDANGECQTALRNILQRREQFMWAQAVTDWLVHFVFASKGPGNQAAGT